MLVDADALAREVVEPGTPGLARWSRAFGQDILTPDGGLDRPRLGALVFGDPERLAVLNGIVHPLVREQAAALIAARPAGAVVVQDIPLLVETGQGSSFHLVLVVDAPDDVRVQRMVQHRHMTEEEARSRMAAQAAAGRPAGSGRRGAGQLRHHGGTAGRGGPAVEVPAGTVCGELSRQRPAPRGRRAGAGTRTTRTGARQAGRLIARLRAAARDGHPGRGPHRIHCRSRTRREGRHRPPAGGGGPGRRGPDRAAAGRRRLSQPGPGPLDSPKPGARTRRDWSKRLHGNADPGRPVNLHVRAAGSPGWRFALCFRDWLPRRRGRPGRLPGREAPGRRAPRRGQIHRRVRRGQGSLVHGVRRAADGRVGPAHGLAAAVVRRPNPGPGRSRTGSRTGSGTAQS